MDELAGGVVLFGMITTCALSPNPPAVTEQGLSAAAAEAAAAGLIIKFLGTESSVLTCGLCAVLLAVTFILKAVEHGAP